ncbi:unnamed protein product [Gordionus sp. m RMFG-2023]
MKNIVILGGGISGLSSAYYLLKSTNAKVTIIEKSKSIGGWIKSHQYDNNIVLERGPRTIRAYGFAAKSTLNLKCIPQYHVGHSDILNNIREIIENNNLPIRLVGASYDGISVNDCIHSAKIMCDKISTSF